MIWHHAFLSLPNGSVKKMQQCGDERQPASSNDHCGTSLDARFEVEVNWPGAAQMVVANDFRDSNWPKVWLISSRISAKSENNTRR
jgi:hypothetical protein